VVQRKDEALAEGAEGSLRWYASSREVEFRYWAHHSLLKAVTKRAGRKKDANNAQAASSGGGQPQVKKAIFESTKKKEVGVSDLTLISKISNEAINENLKKRFENGEIYVRGAGIVGNGRRKQC